MKDLMPSGYNSKVETNHFLCDRTLDGAIESRPFWPKSQTS